MTFNFCGSLLEVPYRFGVYEEDLHIERCLHRRQSFSPLLLLVPPVPCKKRDRQSQIAPHRNDVSISLLPLTPIHICRIATLKKVGSRAASGWLLNIRLRAVCFHSARPQGSM